MVGASGFRAHFAATLIKGGAPIAVVQGALGTRSLSASIAYYRHITEPKRR
jgi:site-specific recombinase XerD